MRMRCKYEPTGQEAELIQANPDDALVRLPNGKESNVSRHHLTPVEEGTTIFVPEAVTIVSNCPISYLDGNKIPKPENTVPQLVSSD